jgi:DNA polymerase-3 subunit alpha
VISQYDKDDVEAVGLVKFDIWPSAILTILDLAVRYVQEAQDRAGVAPGDRLGPRALRALMIPRRIKFLKPPIPLRFSSLKAEGVKKLLKKLEPDRFEDIIAVLALYPSRAIGFGHG